MAPVDLKGNQFDIAKEKDALPPDASKTNYILIELKEELKQNQSKTLTDAKVLIEEFVGNLTYLCRYEPTDLKQLEKLPFVKNAVVYPTRVKISPDLQQAIQAGGTNGQPIRVAVHLQDDYPGGASKVLEQLTAFTKPTVYAKNDVIILMDVDTKFVKNVADLDGVRSIGIDYPISFESTIARGIMDADIIQLPPNDQGLNGEGQIVTVADNGFDKGNIADVHPAFGNRVRRLISVGRQNTGQTNDENGHGTHVAGCCLGDGSLSDGNPAQNGRVRGTAPRAELVVQSLYDPVLKGYNPLSRTDRIDEAIREGSYIMNNSYAISNAKEKYDTFSAEIDIAIYRNPDFVAVFGSGNQGESQGLISQGAGCKNGITVGASFSSRSLGAKVAEKPLNQWSFDPIGWPGDPRSVAGFSNCGPAIGDRIKPDVVAPGCTILSAASRDPKAQKSIGEYGPAPNNLYCYKSGTSMAAPLVTGCVAVIRQALMRYRQPNLPPPNTNARPKAALIKALLIHGAKDLATGTYQNQTIGATPNFIQGHGLVDLSRSLIPVIDANDPLHGIWEARTAGIDVPVVFDTRTPNPAPNPANPPPRSYGLQVTLVYTDLQGKLLQNELMLEAATLADDGTERVGTVRNVGDNVLRLKYDNINLNTRVQIRVVARRLQLATRQSDFSVIWTLNPNA